MILLNHRYNLFYYQVTDILLVYYSIINYSTGIKIIGIFL